MISSRKCETQPIIYTHEYSLETHCTAQILSRKHVASLIKKKLQTFCEFNIDLNLSEVNERCVSDACDISEKLCSRSSAVGLCSPHKQTPTNAGSTPAGSAI